MDSDDEPLTSLASKPVPPPVKIEPPKPPPTSQSVPPPSGDKPAASPSESKGDTGDNMTEVERAKYKARLKEIRKFEKARKKAKKEEKEKKRKMEESGKSNKRSSSSSSTKRVKTEAAVKELKAQDKAERLSQAMKAFCWWDAPSLDNGRHWNKMEHGGVIFPPPYEPHGVEFKYDGKTVTLSPLEEEAVNFFAAMPLNSPYLVNEKTKKIFTTNYFSDLRNVFSKENKAIIKDFNKCDFSMIRSYLEQQQMVRKAKTDGQKKEDKKIKDANMFKYGFAFVDGHLEKVGNYNMEPPGTFRGRGEHPKMGKLKDRVAPESVYLNISEDSPAPICNLPGHSWHSIRHDPNVQWLANWKENINQQDKYMQLAAMSSFKGKSDRSKYNKAARLCGNIDKIRRDYKKNLKSKEKDMRQLATAMWVIDRLALRVGGEKDTDEEADTVGCCSLRVEHLNFSPDDCEEADKAIELEFLGKDSMLFKQTVKFGSALYTENDGMGETVYENFKDFCKKKKSTEDVFETLTPSVLNSHLSSLMPGLSAKVFRTYNASMTLQAELAKKEKLDSWANSGPADKTANYNDANRIVAILCNHQKTVSAAQETQLDVISTKLETLRSQKKVMKKILKCIQRNEFVEKIPLKKSEEELIEKANKALAEAKKMKEEASTDEEKVAATKADLEAKKLKKDAGESKFNQAHLWEKVPSESQVVSKIQNWTKKIEKMETDLKHKDDNKEVSLGTSKINYMDPRITVAFCKRNEVPIERIFSRTLRDKFNWAMSVEPAWEFNAEIGKQE